ncbi:MAG TPA: hypothetical protein VJ302_04825, partial [Blastocatellia bacterium]|nr:hypothetical protein [Blastocatellia bacterium]
MKVSLRRTLLSSLCLCSLLLPSPALPQTRSTPPKKFDLTIDNIMRGPDLVGYEPTGVYWSQDGQRVYFRWKRAGEPRLRESALYRVEIAELGRSDEGLRKLTEEEIKQAPPSSGDLSSDKKLTVFSEDGDIFIYDHAKHERRQLTSTIDGENSPKFTADQKYIVFTRQNNLYRMSLDGTSLTQLTDIRTGGGSSDTPPRGNESQEYLKDEERNLIEA